MAAAARSAALAPAFEVDPLWPKPLPNHWVLGSTIGVSVDENDHVWIIHRSSATLGNNEKGLELKPPTGECCAGAPPVLEFDQAGNLLSHWGGPGDGFEWPTSNHGITIDYKGNVWIGGNGNGDAQLLKFTKSGKFLLQVGRANARQGPANAEGVSTFPGNSNDTTSFGRVAKIFVDARENEAYISDGYLNKRVVVLDADSGAFKRYWGAYGNKPDDTNLGPYNPDAPPAPQFRNPVHCAELSVDRLLYVCDRVNNRIQVFTPDGKFVKEVVHREEEPGRGCGVGHRVLEGRGPELHLPGGWTEHEGAHPAPRHARRADQLRRRRTAAGAVLRAAQRRGGLEGQSLHDRDLRG